MFFHFSLSRKSFAARLLLSIFSLGLTTQIVVARDYPSNPIRLLVPYAAGGTTDIVGRIFAKALTIQLGKPVIVENIAGAGGMVGASMLVRAKPDGYTLGMATVSTMATAPLMERKPTYNPLADFTPISLIADVPNVMTVNPGIPAKTIAEFVALLKANPDKYAFASSGVGSIAHLDGELFKSLTKTEMVHVPYRGSGPALNDTAAGRVAAQFDNLSSSLPYIKAGRLRALAVASTHRAPELPDVPTYAEAGLPKMNNMAWFGLVGPKNLPSDIQKVLIEATAKALADPQAVNVLKQNGAQADATNSQAFSEIIQREYALRKQIVEQAHVVIN
jgi:tripartite-type tricarboxylate transporter receptor subunit TctC